MTEQKKSLTIREFGPKDATLMSSFLRSQTPEYSKFFYAFAFDEPSIAEMLATSRADIYSGVFWKDELIGLFMLRGWDAGYEIPSIGMFISENYRGKGILKLTLDAAKINCKLSGVNKYMMKTHPDNKAFKNLQRLGFYQTGVEESTGNIVYHIDF